MAKNRRHTLKSQLTFLIQSTTGMPLAFHLDVRAASLIALMLSAAFLLTLSGSLLFFRELEINRRLLDRVLELEISEKLSALSSAANLTVSRFPSAIPMPAANPSTEPEAATGGRARVGLLNVECASEVCNVALSLVPTEPGLVKGSVLIIMETEIPRIGTANANSSIRERYFIYPGNTTQDELSQEDLLKIPGSVFHFSKGVQRTVEFNIGGLLRPLAVNIYLFDNDHNLIQHERKVIETAG